MERCSVDNQTVYIYFTIHGVGGGVVAVQFAEVQPSSHRDKRIHYAISYAAAAADKSINTQIYYAPYRLDNSIRYIITIEKANANITCY